MITALVVALVAAAAVYAAFRARPRLVTPAPAEEDAGITELPATIAETTVVADHRDDAEVHAAVEAIRAPLAARAAAIAERLGGRVVYVTAVVSSVPDHGEGSPARTLLVEAHIGAPS